MPLLQLGPGFSPLQIDGFPADCERSRKGALYLRPRSVEEVTEGELAHVLKVKPELRKFMVVHRPKPKKAPSKPAVTQAYKKEEPKKPSFSPSKPDKKPEPKKEDAQAKAESSEDGDQ